MKRDQSVGFLAQLLGCALVALLSISLSATPANALTEVDNFDDVVDYGALGPGDYPSGIWDGSYNMANLGSGLFASNFFSDGLLRVDDDGTFDADGTPPASGFGWEGGRSTAPFLFSNVPANQDFTATVKVDEQSTGFWSSAGIIARANQGTAPGVGADNADEHFVTAYRFGTDLANPQLANTLSKRIENGAQLADLNVEINPGTIPNPTPPPDTLPNPEPLPNWIQLRRIGGVGYRTYVSLDGTTWQLQSHTIPTATSFLRASSGVDQQVGVSFMTFNRDRSTFPPEDGNSTNGAAPGSAAFDYFELETFDLLASPGVPDLAGDVELVWGPGDAPLSHVFADLTGQGILNFTRVADPLNPVRPPQPPANALSTFGPNGLVPMLTPDNSGSATFAWNPANWTQGNYQWNITATNDWGESDTVSLLVRIVPEPVSSALVGLAVLSLAGCAVRRRKA